MRNYCLFIVFLLLWLPAPLAAEDYYPAIAAVQDNSLFFFYDDGREPLLIDSGARAYSSLVWSPDGTYLAYSRLDDQFNHDIMITDAAGSTPIQLVDNWQFAFPRYAWTDDNRLLYHIAGLKDSGTDIFLDVIAKKPTIDGEETIIATVPFGTGCDESYAYPGYHFYNVEMEGFGGVRPLLEQVPMGIVYSRDCTAANTALFVPGTGEVFELGTGLYNVDISPDRSRIVGLQYDEQEQPTNRLVFVTLETREITEMPALYPVYDVQWTGENALFYASHYLFEEISLSRIAARLLNMETLTSYYARVVFYNPATMREEIVIDIRDSFRIGRIAPTGDPLRIYASVIPIGRDWLKSLDAGNTSTDATDYTEFFTPHIYFAEVNESGYTSGTTYQRRSLITPNPMWQTENE